MIISNNISSLNSLNRLQKNNKATTNVLEKLSSGLRINKASDDSAGLAISEKMRAQIRGLRQAQRNIQDGISFIQTAESGLGSIQDPNLIRLRELAIQSANDTLTNEDRQQIQKEVEQIKSGINEIANNTEFNEINLLNVQNTITNSTKTGINWREIDTGLSTTPFYDVSYNGNFYLAVGYQGQVLRSDDNGENWYEPFSPVNSVNLHTIEFDGSDFIITENTNIYKSPDGYARNGAYFPSSGRLYDADYVGGKYLTVGENGFIGVSSDFVNWTEPISGTANNLMDVASDGASYVVVGDNGTIMFSNDTVNWNDVSIPSLTSDFEEVIFDGGKYVAVGGYNVVTSTDGVNWKNTYTTTNAILVDIKYDGERFIGIGKDYSNIAYSVYSNDGINWEEESMNLNTSTLSAIEWDGNEYLAIGYGGKFYKGKWEEINETEPPKITLQVGANSGENFPIELTDARTTALGIDGIDLSTRQGAESAISKIDKAMETVSSERGKFGAYQNRLEHALSNASNYEINLTASASRIRDSNMAKEMMELTKNNILSQASQAMLVHANQQPQQVLQLLK